MNLLKGTGKVLLITLIHFISFIVATTIISLGPEFALTEAEAEAGFPFVVLSSLLISLIVFLFFKQANTRNFKALTILLISIFGIGTFMPQTDTWYFIDAFPTITTAVAVKIVFIGLISYLIYIPLSFFISGSKNNPIAKFDFKEYLSVHNMKVISAVAIIYIAIYYLAGYFIAWQFEAVRIHYSGSAEKLSFIGQTINVLTNDSMLFPFQFIRGIMWTLFMVPVLMYLSENRKKMYWYSAILLAFLTSMQLLIPNPLMPFEVRMGHLIEGLVSNAIFGLVLAYFWNNYFVTNTELSDEKLNKELIGAK